MSRPYVGIMVNTMIYNAIPRERTGFEHLPFYEEAGEMYGFIPCYFRLKDIEPGDERIQAYTKDETGQYIKQSIPIPKVIHNRGIFMSKKDNKKIQKLMDSGILIFNKKNRYQKLQIHEILLMEERLQAHLPVTMRASENNILKMLEAFNSVIIKPNNSSLGLGVMLLQKEHGEYKWTFRNRKTKTYETQAFTADLPQQLIDMVEKRFYIVQERIPLASYQGNPFDLRVSVQRDGTGEWQVTGIVGKVANKGNFVTNVARGGKVYPLDVLLEEKQLNYNEVYKAIKYFSIQAAELLSKKLDGLADIGLDIGITEAGFPMLIECNARDLRITFRNAKMLSTWKATHINPMSYASYLLEQSHPD